MKYTREMRFKEFLESIYPGVVMAVIMILIIGLGGGFVAALIHEAELEEQNFYKALQGKEVNDSNISGNLPMITEIYQGKFRNWTEPQWVNFYHILQGDKVDYDKAMITKAVVEEIYEGKFQDWENLEDRISSLGANRNIGSVYYALENWPKVREFIENPGKEVPPEDSVGDFANWLPKAAFWIIFFLISISYASEGYENQNQSMNKRWWQYPWRKWWAYMVAPIMLPFIVVTQPLVLGYMIMEERREKNREGHNIFLLGSIKKAEEKLETLHTEAKNKGIVLAGKEVDYATNGLLKAKNTYDARNYDFAESYLREADNCLNKIQGRLDNLNQQREEYEKRITEAKKKKDKSRDKFGRIRETELIAKQKTIGKEIAAVKQNLSDLGKQIEQKQRELALKTKQAKEIKEIISKGNDQDFLKQFDEISALPLIRAIEAEGSDIKIYTDTIFISYRGELELFKGKYEIGSFIIRFDIGSSIVQEISNLVNTSFVKDGHPYGNGEICFGNLADHIRKALNERNYVLATLLILQSLQTGDGDYPEKLKYWKKVN